ncbi:MAG: single-stranded DNA-binding protein, partial [Akkermansiaceae bacterium]|nr:single-stranded DNA-binding protein [Akkermansiaceae bacterium]
MTVANSASIERASAHITSKRKRPPLLPSIFVEGNLTDEPELRFTPSGKAMATFTVVSSDRRRNDAGEWEDVDTSFFNCVA